MAPTITSPAAVVVISRDGKSLVPMAPVATSNADIEPGCALYDDAIAYKERVLEFGMLIEYAEPVGGFVKYHNSVQVTVPDDGFLVLSACVNATPLYVGAPPVRVVLPEVTMDTTSSVPPEPTV